MQEQPVLTCYNQVLLEYGVKVNFAPTGSFCLNYVNIDFRAFCFDLSCMSSCVHWMYEFFLVFHIGREMMFLSAGVLSGWLQYTHVQIRHLSSTYCITLQRYWCFHRLWEQWQNHSKHWLFSNSSITTNLYITVAVLI